jgi:hypothetical protein
MDHTNYQGFPPSTSLAHELINLMSDPRTQNAIASVKLAGGHLVELNPQRRQCDVCKNFLANQKSHDDHKECCYATCKQHKLFEPVPLTQRWMSYHIPVGSKDPSVTARKVLDHAADPSYVHTCCFVEGCNYPERIPSGWDNLEIMEHVIISHTEALLNDQQRTSLLQGFRRPQKIMPRGQGDSGLLLRHGLR